MKSKLIALLLCLSSLSNAQFVLTPVGFVSSEDPTKDYVVYSFEGKNQNELFKSALLYVTSHYSSPQDVISKVENEMLTINGIELGKIGLGKVSETMFLSVYDINYTIVLKFKDEKIRIDAPAFLCTTISDGKSFRLTLNDSGGGFGSEVRVGIFNEAGKVSRKSTKIQLEDFFKAQIVEIINYLTNPSVDEW